MADNLCRDIGDPVSYRGLLTILLPTAAVMTGIITFFVSAAMTTQSSAMQAALDGQVAQLGQIMGVHSENIHKGALSESRYNREIPILRVGIESNRDRLSELGMIILEDSTRLKKLEDMVGQLLKR